MTTQRDDLKELFNKYCEWQSHNNRGTQIGIYSIAFIGLSVALRRVRPFKKFTKPDDVPNSYIRNRREITGEVCRIEPNGAVLMVKHSPIIKVPFVHKHNEDLPVKIANVNINSLGINWLQSIVSGNQVTFVPLSKYSKYLLCEVNLTQKLPKQKKEQTINLGESLCSIGFGKYENRPIKVNDIMHKIYIDRLMYAEELYVKREMGIKYYYEPTKALLINILSIFRMLSLYPIVRLVRFIKSRLPKQQAKAKKTDEKQSKKLTSGSNLERKQLDVGSA